MCIRDRRSLHHFVRNVTLHIKNFLNSLFNHVLLSFISLTLVVFSFSACNVLSLSLVYRRSSDFASSASYSPNVFCLLSLSPYRTRGSNLCFVVQGILYFLNFAVFTPPCDSAVRSSNANNL